MSTISIAEILVILGAVAVPCLGVLVLGAVVAVVIVLVAKKKKS